MSPFRWYSRSRSAPLGIILVCAALACRGGGADDTRLADSAVRHDSAAGEAHVNVRAAGAPSSTVLSEADARMYREMAQHSLDYLNANWQDATGLVNATPEWKNTTMWDVGGQLLAYHAARDLGLVSASDYDRRTRRTLATLERVPLAWNTAFNKLYTTTTGAPSTESHPGWSATDLGRLFLALHIVAARDTQYAAQIRRIVQRNDFRQLVDKGYLAGQITGSNGKPWRYQEGRIGYEQYVANGFAQWGADVAPALSMKQNAKSVQVLGHPLLADTRYQDRLLSEPFILYGVELGLSGEMRDLAMQVLAVQQARFDSTGTITIASEDAMPVAPEYFYYYCVYCDAKPFVVQGASSDQHLAGPRWVSTKGAHGWYALVPNDYTRKAMEYVSVALDPKRGWASGVYENKHQSTGSFDVNTAAVLLEIAYFRLRGDKPLADVSSNGLAR